MASWSAATERSPDTRPAFQPGTDVTGRLLSAMERLVDASHQQCFWRWDPRSVWDFDDGATDCTPPADFTFYTPLFARPSAAGLRLGGMYMHYIEFPSGSGPILIRGRLVRCGSAGRRFLVGGTTGEPEAVACLAGRLTGAPVPGRVFWRSGVGAARTVSTLRVRGAPGAWALDWKEGCPSAHPGKLSITLRRTRRGPLLARENATGWGEQVFPYPGRLFLNTVARGAGCHWAVWAINGINR